MPFFSNPACKTAYLGKKLSYPVMKHKNRHIKKFKQKVDNFIQRKRKTVDFVVEK
jgi:hypothetical protein